MSHEISAKYVKIKRNDQSVKSGAPKTVALQEPGAPKIRDAMLAARLAGDTIGAMRNFRIRDAEKHFPHQPMMRTVEKYYPYAKGGPLLVDEPNTEREVTACQEKAKILKSLGYRYLILQSDVDEFEARQMLEAI